MAWKKLMSILIITSSLDIPKSHAIIIKVPGDYQTIQTALIASNVGDTVLVSPGIYKENLVWPDRGGIKLISAGDSCNTIIDGDGKSSVIYINPVSSSIDSTTVIKGFCISKGGAVQNGAGITIINASPLLSSLSITSNNSTINGGGIYILLGSPILRSIRMENNTASWGGGVAIESQSCPIFADIIISQNYASRYGAGVCILGGTSTFKNTVILGNNAGVDGGGLGFFNSGSAIFLKNVYIIDNLAQGNGGGIFIGTSDVVLDNLSLIGNKSSLGGGAIAIQQHSNRYSNLTILGNNDAIGYNGIYSYHYGSFAIESSNFESNGIGIFNGNNSAIIKATNNWWGHLTGPYHSIQNPSGLGDSVNAFVEVSPWLASTSTSAPPTPVKNLTIDNVGSDFIALSWNTDVISDLSGYKIYYDSNSQGYPYSSCVDVGNTTFYKISGLATATTYHLAATAYDVDGNESWYSDEIQATTGSEPVPIELSSFIAIAKENKILIKWTTKTESNNYGFEIQRKIDKEWNTIGFMSGCGTRVIEKEYRFIDTLSMGFTGNVFYRLKQIDFDGSISFTNEISVTLLLSSYLIVENYPNPFNSRTKIRYSLPYDTYIELSLFNLNGRKVQTIDKGNKSKGAFILEFDSVHLASGIYFLELKSNDISVTKKCLLQK
jgi:hypothetical protein